MKKSIVLAAVLGVAFTARAQSSTPAACASLQTENAALKDKLVAYEARLGVGKAAIDGTYTDPAAQVRFVACTASKRTQTVTFTCLLENTGAVFTAFIVGGEFMKTGDRCRAVDQTGTVYNTSKALIGTDEGRTSVPAGVPVKVMIQLPAVPTTTPSFNLVELVLLKDTPSGQQAQTMSFRNVPIVWKP